ncbi:hypothetical protein U879_00655 [Defluviimonas sp. 20V17]|uniref:Phospholipase_D-nuclease N-terminal n=1 Tax=Allgaiera indica TaxID=765699 RepID=A0AAN5A0K7_9RHOB|nr:PLDc N-terminal domain-containing protein [Allgaiera indica]KDB05636.1 hypothetical protein U879_00655 [Defluviimonas sp. 20V17]GHE04393.1 hypothetical protein GCM10008024_31460 [Allgaiera indica]SDX41038.1 Phospholipase_D-nuclease N-terminal [Allgaiera indica]
MFFLSTIGSVIILILDILAIISVIGSAESSLSKLVWVLVILFLPVIGLILWWVIGPRARTGSI